MEHNKDITIGLDSRLKMKAGVDKAATATNPTLGPIGMTAGIEFPGLDPLECDDAVTILKNLKFEDRHENMGLQKLRKAALRTSAEGGDGTATTTKLTQALVAEAFKEIASDSSKIREVRERLQAGLKEAITQLSLIKRDVTHDDIERIANVSTLDPEVSKIIAEIVKEVGVHGVVTVEKGSKIGYEKEIVKGARFNRGYVSQYFINDRETETSTLEKPFVLLVDRRLSVGAQLKPIMDVIPKDCKSILVVADAVDGTALASLIQASKMVTVVGADGKQSTGTYDVCAVTNPFTATPGKEFLKDMAALTGATVVSEEAGMKLSECGITVLGRAEKVIVTKDTTTIVGCGDSPSLQNRVASIKAEIESSTSEYQKLMLQERLARLDGGIGIIRVGAYTDTEFNEKKYKFDNGIRSVQAALLEGVLPGGGSALAKLRPSDPMFKEMFVAPFKQMAINAGLEWHEWLHYATANNTDGVDFVTKHPVNMFDIGIIDPFKVTRLALESAVAIATSLIKMEVTITVKDELKDNK